MTTSSSVSRRPGTLSALLAISLFSCWRFNAPKLQPSLPVTVEQLSVTFEAEDRGQLTLSLLAKNPEQDTGHVNAIEWELWFNGRRFAEGVQAIDQLIEAGETRFKTTIPLTTRKRQRVRGPVVLRVGIRGRLVVTYGRSDEWLAFAQQLETTVANAPISKNLEED